MSNQKNHLQINYYLRLHSKYECWLSFFFSLGFPSHKRMCSNRCYPVIVYLIMSLLVNNHLLQWNCFTTVWFWFDDRYLVGFLWVLTLKRNHFYCIQCVCVWVNELLRPELVCKIILIQTVRRQNRLLAYLIRCTTLPYCILLPSAINTLHFVNTLLKDFYQHRTLVPSIYHFTELLLLIIVWDVDERLLRAWWRTIKETDILEASLRV